MSGSDDDSRSDDWPEADDAGVPQRASESENVAVEDYVLASDAAADGDLDEVIRLYHAACPVSPLERGSWALLLVAAGAAGEAVHALSSIADPALRAELAGLLDGRDEDTPVDADRALESEDDDELFAIDLRPLEAGRPDDALVQRFLDFFGGRRDLYARQWFDEKRGRGGYRPVREPLTAAVARSHLEGRVTLGQYLLWPDASCSFGVIDLDLGASSMQNLRASHGEEVSALRHDGLRHYLRRLREAGQSLGLRLFAEDSGGRGAHLWLFVRPRRPARVLRQVLAQVVAAGGPQPADVGVEVFPKQQALGPRGLSSLVKLPLGLHLGTMRRCELLDASLRPIARAEDALIALAPSDASRFDDVAGHRVVALPAPELSPVGRAPVPQAAPTPRSLAEAMRHVGRGEDVPEQDERDAAQAMVESCPILGGLVSKAWDERRLTPDEARAITYSLGLVGERAELAREVMTAAGATFKELERVRQGLPSPIGCKKLRALHTGPSPCEGCPAGEMKSPYPTPAFFAVGEVAIKPPEHLRFAAHLDADAGVVQTPFDALAESLTRIEGRLERMESASRVTLKEPNEGSEP